MAKTVIVTGASRGIGLAIVQYLLKTSNDVVVIARSKDALEKLREKHPEHVRVLVGDLGDLSLAQKGVDLAAKEFGRLDGLIVNHGIIDPVTKLRDTNAEDWKKTFDVNFMSAVAFAKAALPLLNESKGCILFTSSGVSVGAVSTWGAYGATKAAMNHLAGQLACEEPEVTSISVRPGVVDTEMQRELREVHSSIMAKKDNDKFLGLHREGKLLKPSDPGDLMAKMVLDPPRELNGKFIR
ncbi:hypothetical protein OEA41_003863 [Lepraria neglecta]|uniref:Ketoreductase domain-containing protein n=1 Tax=Lepraria neglecta TaxID=209136 RepID=A0AAD9Z536_9LECA|nr:hypothetical protein OEA41_003863 [Lepraria neglecta]